MQFENAFDSLDLIVLSNTRKNPRNYYGFSFNFLCQKYTHTLRKWNEHFNLMSFNQ